MSSIPEFAVVVPWHNPEQREAFLKEWKLTTNEPWLVLQHDENGEGCARTKNRGIEHAIACGAEAIIVLDDDCFPDHRELYVGGRARGWLENFARAHIKNLEPRSVPGFATITAPPSRGTPYLEANRQILRPVAASMGYWTKVGDYCAVRQLIHEGEEMEGLRSFEDHRYFPLSGMNLAFMADQMPWSTFIDVPRYDDIWMGWLWQKHAFGRGAVFALDGPKVRHARQSNVWRNLKDEARFAEQNETLWREIAHSPHASYESLRQLLPA